MASIQALNDLNQALGDLPNAVGWLTVKPVTYSTPGASALYQGRADHVLEGLVIAHQFTVFEEFFPPNFNNSGVPREWQSHHISTASLERFLAYRHVRHSMIHGFAGTRATSHAVEFDAVMQSANPLSQVDWDQAANIITIQKGAWHPLLTFMKDVAIHALANCASHGPPAQLPTNSTCR